MKIQLPALLLTKLLTSLRLTRKQLHWYWWKYLSGYGRVVRFPGYIHIHINAQVYKTCLEQYSGTTNGKVNTRSIAQVIPMANVSLAKDP